MENSSIILTVISLGFAFNFALMRMMWHSMNARFSELSSRIDKLDEKVTDIDRRLCRIEGIMSAKDCCVLKADDSRKAE